MKITPQADDASEFVDLVEHTVNGILRRYSPAVLLLIKIDNWFGSRWLGFTGKLLGISGLTINTIDNSAAKIADKIVIPPFVPERVVSQRRFVAPDFEEMEAGEPVHLHISSGEAMRRKAALTLPGTALVWYSGNSKKNRRASLMAYLPLDSSYWPWFVDVELGGQWRIAEIRGIKSEDFASLAERKSEHSVLNAD